MNPTRLEDDLTNAVDEYPESLLGQAYTSLVRAARVLAHHEELARKWVDVIRWELDGPDDPEPVATVVVHKCGWCPACGTRRMQITDNATGTTREAYACDSHRGDLVTWVTSA